MEKNLLVAKKLRNPIGGEGCNFRQETKHYTNHRTPDDTVPPSDRATSV